MIIRRVASCALAAGAVLLGLPAAAQAAVPAAPAPAASSTPATVVPSLSFSASPPYLVYDQSVTFTGTDTDVGTGMPIVGQEVDVYAGQGGTQLGSFTTDNAGQFSFTVTAGIGDAADLYEGLWAVAVANATTAAGTASFMPFVYLDGAVLGGLPYIVHAHYDSTIAVSGNVTFFLRDAGGATGTTTPLSGDTVTFVARGCWGDSGNGVCGPPPTYTGITDASGNFTVQVPAQFPEQYTVTAGDSPAVPSAWQETDVQYVGIATDHLPVRDHLIAQATTKPDIIAFTSCAHLGEPAGVPVAFFEDQGPLFNELSIQYAPSKSGPWTTLVTSPPRNEGGVVACSWPHIRKPRPGELYYRTTTPASTIVLAGASPAVRPTSAFQSAVSNLKLTPARLKSKGWVSVSGKLSTADPVPPA